MKSSKFLLILLLVVISYFFFRYAIHPRLPSSLLYFYVMIVGFSIFIYLVSDTRLLHDFLEPIRSIIVKNDNKLIEERNKEIRWLIFGLLPFFVVVIVYLHLCSSVPPPPELRSIHPSPPLQITFRGQPIRIESLENPLRKKRELLDKYVEEGAVIYFENCFYCHGDNLDGNGHFADAVNPRPANFTDTGTIAQLQESYVFWRISKGGKGLPAEGTPWNSSMPAWEDFLTKEDIWKVIMFIYETTGMEPRRWETKP